MLRFCPILLCLLSAAGCTRLPVPPTATASMPSTTAAGAATTILVVNAAPDRGFNFPYLLRLAPNLPAHAPTFLLVEPNNSGHVSDLLEEHLAAARQLAERAVGADVARRLNLPLLVPVFPRSEALYTHSLNRRTLVAQSPLLRRIDLQLLAMVKDAKWQLAARGVVIHEKVLLTGFSASGAFVNRFTALHPDHVQAVAAGAVNGMLILPRSVLGETRLPYPIGVDDLAGLTGQAFQPQAWKSVRQFIYMGAEDTNDAVRFDDAYTAEQRDLIYRLLGEKMQPDRWEHCQDLYRKANANVEFRTYPGIGHRTNGKIHADIAEFFRDAMRARADR